AVPRFLEFVTELPRTENGKVQKYKLRERGVGPNTWDREKALDREKTLDRERASGSPPSK
ncbi:MAG: hypothetical protein JO137_15555, partial [Hyphomicrobiales bacterium]|nr:hypothetical protein [Hyphomicrobiales bacterium]